LVVGPPAAGQTKNILGDKLTITELDNLLKLKKERLKRIEPKKKMALDLLGQLEELKEDDHKLLSEIIEKTTDIRTIEVIMRLLMRSYCLGESITNNVVDEKIKIEAAVNEFIK